jgi:hypothetical protein
VALTVVNGGDPVHVAVAVNDHDHDHDYDYVFVYVEWYPSTSVCDPV